MTQTQPSYDELLARLAAVEKRTAVAPTDTIPNPEIEGHVRNLPRDENGEVIPGEYDENGYWVEPGAATVTADSTTGAYVVENPPQPSGHWVYDQDAPASPVPTPPPSAPTPPVAPPATPNVPQPQSVPTPVSTWGNPTS